MPQPTAWQRFLLAFIAFFKVLLDRAFAGQVWALRQGEPLPAPAGVLLAPAGQPAADARLHAIHLLAMLQRDGRLVDFLQEDLAGASDADVAAAVKSTVHEGCRKTIAPLHLGPVIDQPEGSTVTVEPGFDPAAIRLTGNVVGAPPFKGSLKHRGWKVSAQALPEPPRGYDGKIVAPAEVELT